MKDSSLQRPFSTRAFVALVVALSTAGLPVTGIVNHCYAFDRLTPVRHAWMAAHNILGLLFVVFGLWHAAINHRALVSHFHGISRRMPAVSRELLLAGAMVATLTSLFVAHGFLLRR